MLLKTTAFTDENRIITEGQKDGERNIPELGSYAPAQFEQALIAHGEQKVQQIYGKASPQVAKLQPVFQALQKRLTDIEARLKPLADSYKTRKKELDRDIAIPFPTAVHLALILFLAIGEFPLNLVVFRLFGEAEAATYVMSSTLAITIPLLGLFIGIHLRHSLPRLVGNILIGIMGPVSVGGALYGVSLLRNAYILSQGAAASEVIATSQDQMAYALFALNALVFCAALIASFFAHDPDEKLDRLHSSILFLDRKKNYVRKNLFRVGTKLNGTIQKATSDIAQARALTSERCALYRQTNMRSRSLLPPPSFRKDPVFPDLKLWSEVSLTNDNGTP